MAEPREREARYSRMISEVLLVPMRSGETPVPIPNTTVKT